jgi:hypothetical protein
MFETVASLLLWILSRKLPSLFLFSLDTVRERLNIEGNLIADFALAAFAYPQVILQILEEYKENPDHNKEEVDV